MTYKQNTEHYKAYKKQNRINITRKSHKHTTFVLTPFWVSDGLSNFPSQRWNFLYNKHLSQKQRIRYLILTSRTNSYCLYLQNWRVVGVFLRTLDICVITLPVTSSRPSHSTNFHVILHSSQGAIKHLNY